MHSRFKKSPPLVCLSFTSAMFLVSIDGIAQTCVNPPQNMIGWYTGDTDASNFVGTDTGTLIGGAQPGVSGLVDGGFGLDGVDDVVSFLPPPYVEGNSYTYDLWFQAPSSCADLSESHGTILSVGRELLVWRDNTLCNNLLVTYSKPGTGRANPGVHIIDAADLAFVPGEWNHLTVTFDGTGTGTLSAFMNGAFASSTSTPTRGANYSACVTDGPRLMNVGGYCRNEGGYHLFFGGVVDELEIFDRALSASEIQSIYAAGSAGKCKQSSVIAKLTFDRRDVDKGQPGGDNGKEFVADLDLDIDGSVDDIEVVGFKTRGGGRVQELTNGDTEGFVDMRGFKTPTGFVPAAGATFTVADLVEEGFRFNQNRFGIDKSGKRKNEGFPGDEGESGGAKELNGNEILLIDFSDGGFIAESVELDIAISSRDAGSPANTLTGTIWLLERDGDADSFSMIDSSTNSFSQSGDGVVTVPLSQASLVIGVVVDQGEAGRVGVSVTGEAPAQP